MDHVILNHGQVMKTTPVLALPPSDFHATPTGFNRLNVYRLPSTPRKKAQENNEKYRQKGEPDLEQTFKTKRSKITAQSVPCEGIRRDGINHLPIWAEKRIWYKFPNCKGYTQIECEKCQ
ncbi:hypothetical protein TNCV_5012731 [Trichonephila clavipes]|nr:hypothetical protein TNCV_5012731 [Trichonephila clavipes]